MATSSVLATRKELNVARLTRNSKLFKSIIKAVQEKKGGNVISLDLRTIPEAVTDFFIICQATSSIHVRAIADFVEEKVKINCGELPYKHEGYQAQQWILIDYINVVVHIMQPEARKFYKLEEMWSDAELTEYES